MAIIGPFGVEGVGKITSLSKPYPEFLGAVILNGWAPRPMENGTESEITILDIQGSELGDGDTNLDFTGPVVALDGSDRMFLKIAGQNNLKGTGISDCYDTEEIISVWKVR
ncbi:uncharacterized protein LOC112495595 isoform X3 [Citrus sinensis]|uniref:uncharacterized protein LOC112495595 isoform X3 n=1 Tax=Citrus sinensis TaxID=2711 RepID=UPI002279B888|nr:uncharacterized protein LOC112495595 isoform X3 [Citrus sinensis]